MKMIALMLAVLVLGQQDPLERQVMVRLLAALAPVIDQFPRTDDSGASPLGGNTDALWMVRPPEPGERAVEVLANPLNEANQLKANRAMAAIERNIEAAQRRAAAQYDRAVAEAKRTGKSQDVDGVTLGDEGIEGAKIDAESHVTIGVAVNEPAYRFEIVAAEPPVLATAYAGTVATVAFASGTYRKEGVEHFAEAETLVFMGRVPAPQVSKRADNSYEVTGTPTPTDHAGVNTIVLRLKGNEAFVKELLNKTAWSLLAELTK